MSEFLSILETCRPDGRNARCKFLVGDRDINYECTKLHPAFDATLKAPAEALGDNCSAGAQDLQKYEKTTKGLAELSKTFRPTNVSF